MTEHMGPAEHRCPPHVLRVLTETDNEYARQWRSACWQVVARQNAKPTVSEGDRVRFSAAIEFGDGATHQELVLVHARRRIFVTPDRAKRYQLRRSWRSDYDYEVVARNEQAAA